MILRLLAVIGALCGIVALVAAVSVWSLLRHGVSARTEPGTVERAIARGLRRAAMPSDAREQKNPVTMDDAKRKSARAHWADHCAVCHAADGSGATSLAEHMHPRPPDMRSAPTQDLADGELYWIIQNGIRLSGMPAWGEPRPDDPETWDLVAFLRALPGLTADEIEAIKSAMPVSAHEHAEKEAEDVFQRGD
jgi:mono/diheme cytochrome c family protein